MFICVHLWLKNLPKLPTIPPKTRKNQATNQQNICVYLRLSVVEKSSQTPKNSPKNQKSSATNQQHICVYLRLSAVKKIIPKPQLTSEDKKNPAK
ncbi:hypothetical protein H6F73_21645 [Microcoleus sp. FACHB-68]|nr:hypothetical protein [Microcoleus sp. FACHB-68]